MKILFSCPFLQSGDAVFLMFSFKILLPNFDWLTFVEKYHKNDVTVVLHNCPIILWLNW